ncbi:Uncharacterised protein [Candidatus Tiddalikarchaeum anstoanum]|nr:Uncharacterised protein [Candidatus Tiddalikarchaeum anstoanum]
MAYPDSWNCPYCGEFNRFSEKCEKCSFPKLWHCPHCGTIITENTKCPNCGLDVNNPKKVQSMTADTKKSIKNTLIAVSVVFYVLVILGVVFYFNIEDKVTFSGNLFLNNTFTVYLTSLFQASSVKVSVTTPLGFTTNYTAVFNTANNKWYVSNLTASEYGYWNFIFEKTGTPFMNIVEKSVFIGRECAVDADCMDAEKVCQSGVCVKKTPGPFDFLTEAGIIK